MAIKLRNNKVTIHATEHALASSRCIVLGDAIVLPCQPTAAADCAIPFMTDSVNAADVQQLHGVMTLTLSYSRSACTRSECSNRCHLSTSRHSASITGPSSLPNGERCACCRSYRCCACDRCCCAR